MCFPRLLGFGFAAAIVSPTYLRLRPGLRTLVPVIALSESALGAVLALTDGTGFHLCHLFSTPDLKHNHSVVMTAARYWGEVKLSVLEPRPAFEVLRDQTSFERNS